MENEVLFYYLKFALIGAVAGTIMFFLLAGTSLLIVPIIAFAGPLILAYYLKNRAVKDMETNFGVLLDDLKDLLQAGINISDALQITARNDYGPLSVYVKRLAAKVKLGIPFEKAMLITFADIRSSLIRKIITVINQTLRTGGNFMKVFTTSAKYVDKIERLKSQRKSRTMSTLFNAYMMFYVFVMIIIAIQIYFVPLIANQPAINAASLLSGDISSMQVSAIAEKPKIDFSGRFLELIVVQSLFAGPMIGKIAENSLVAGLKHALILFITSVSAYLLAISMFAPAA